MLRPILQKRRTIAIGAGVLLGAQLGAWLSQRVHGRLIMRSLSVGLFGVGARLVLKVAPLALLGIAMTQFARADGQIFETHALAFSHGSVLAIMASVAGLVLGLLIVLALAHRWDRPGWLRRSHGP